MNFQIIAAKAGFFLKKNGPELLTIGGLAAGVCAVIAACSKMKEAEAVHTEEEAALQLISNDSEKSDKQKLADKIKVRLFCGWKYVKVFWLALLLEALSIGSVWYSHGMLVQRNVRLGAAYALLGNTVERYRDRVREKVGAETENELYYDARTEVEEREVVNENGKVKKMKESIAILDGDKKYPYSALFSRETSPNWKESKNNNMIFLKAQQDYANDRLKIDGFLFLNDILVNFLGLPAVKAGQFAGWRYDKRDPRYANSRIDFGLENFDEKTIRAFYSGGSYSDNVLMLSFNCLPDILTDLPIEEK